MGYMLKRYLEETTDGDPGVRWVTDVADVMVWVKGLRVGVAGQRRRSR